MPTGLDIGGTSTMATEREVSGTEKQPTAKLRPIYDMLSGAVAGCVARMVVAPLDVLKIRFQVQSETGGLYRYRTLSGALRDMIRSEGIFSLWKGNVPALLMVAPYASVQFATFYQLETSDSLSSTPPSLRRLTFGALAGAAATVVSFPLDLMRTRIAAEPKRFAGMRDVARNVLSTHGTRGFYLGIGPTLVQIAPYMALHYAAYEHGRDVVTRHRGTSELETRESLLLGATSGVLAKFATLPLDNVKKRMQVAGQFAGCNNAPYKNAADALVKIFNREGITGLFRGTVPNLLKAAPNSAITFAAYEACKRLLLERQERP